MEKVVIVGAKRTAIGKFGGSLKNETPAEFTQQLAKGIIKELILDQYLIEEVIVGNVLQAGQGQNPSRQVALNMGLSYRTPAYTVNKVCGSGLKAVILGTQAIMLGDAQCVLAGGMENMSKAPYLVDCMRWGSKLGDQKMVDSMIKDGLWDAFNQYHMGITAENITEKYSISREEQDQFAFSSQMKYQNAFLSKYFEQEIIPIRLNSGKNSEATFLRDEHPHPKITLDKLSKLKPAFKEDGTVTAGNASGINDGAALTLLMSETLAKKLGLDILAEIISYGYSGVDPAIMGMGPVHAIKNTLEKANLNLNDIELIELNEAFAVQSLAVMKELNIDPEMVNVNGGAIAMGHPIGASGTRILVTLIHELRRRKLNYGMASLCIGGGQGISLLIKRYS